MHVYPALHGSSPGSPQIVAPPGQSCTKQSGGSVGFPMHSSQCSHVLRHACTCVHGLHFVGSARFASVQLPVPAGFSDPSHTVVGAPGIAQHPKQSHPFGVSGPQYPAHVADCVVNADEHDPWYPGMFAFGLYAHCDPSGGYAGPTSSGSHLWLQ